MNYNLVRENNFIKLVTGDSKTRYFKAEDFLSMIVLDSATISFRCPGFVKENVSLQDIRIEGNPFGSMSDLGDALEQLGTSSEGMFSPSYIKKLVEYESGSNVISIEAFNYIFNNENENQLDPGDDFTYFYGKILIPDAAFVFFNSRADLITNTNYLDLSSEEPEEHTVLFAGAVLSSGGSESQQNAVFTGYKIKVQPYATLDFFASTDDAEFTGNITSTVTDPITFVIDYGDGTFDSFTGNYHNDPLAFTHIYKDRGFTYTVKILTDTPGNISGITVNGDIDTGNLLVGVDVSRFTQLDAIDLSSNSIDGDSLINLLIALDNNNVSPGTVDVSDQDGTTLDPDDVPAIADLISKSWTVDYDAAP